jgi:molybdopterin converting factor small subunit
LQLAEKWDTLDVKTQRYIATTAAGSRQQSRFIAMMSDYSRTQELVSAANNSAGASNEQFGKTLETLESKLAKLKNAWDSFTMSVMNNELVKAAVDLLTLILTKVNEISAAFDKFGLGGVASIGIVVAALYLGDKALKVFMTTLRGGGTIFQSFGAIARAAIDSITGRISKTTKTLSNMKKVLVENQKNMKMFGKVKVHVDSKPATKAMSDFTKATNNQIAAQKLRESVSKNNAISEETRMARMAALDKIEAQNEQRKTEAAMAYFAA